MPDTRMVAAPVCRPPIAAVRAACLVWRQGLGGTSVKPCTCEYPQAGSSLGPCKVAVARATAAE